ncbi:MAG: VacJ family lipoprotein [Alphaproteobacteria bacterium]
MFKKIFITILSFSLLISNSAFSNSNYIFPSQMEDDSDTPVSINNSDPFEKYNRKIFTINQYIEKAIFKPITITYMKLLPKNIQKGVSNFVNNLYTPLSFINSALTLSLNDSLTNLWRFILNTSFGVGGFYDFASQAGLKNNKRDFSDTLAFYKFGKGPYIIIPILGPSNGRETIGKITDILIDPINYIPNTNFVNFRTGLIILDSYSDKIKYIDNIEKNSLDPYVTIRSLFLQNKR